MLNRLIGIIIGILIYILVVITLLLLEIQKANMQIDKIYSIIDPERVNTQIEVLDPK